MEWMTIHFEDLVAGLSVVRETWQEPPPCTAAPLKERVCGEPMVMEVTEPPEVLVALQGKSEPSAARGEVDGSPYGGGEAMIMWVVPEEPSVMARTARADLSEGMLLEWVMLTES